MGGFRQRLDGFDEGVAGGDVDAGVPVALAAVFMPFLANTFLLGRAMLGCCPTSPKINPLGLKIMYPRGFVMADVDD
jgi:hypothetical protein